MVEPDLNDIQTDDAGLELFPPEEETRCSSSSQRDESSHCIVDVEMAQGAANIDFTSSTSVESSLPRESDNDSADVHHADCSIEEKVCAFCGASGAMFHQFKRIVEMGRMRRGQKTQYVWRNRCAVKTCNKFFGGFYRFSTIGPRNFIEVREDGNSLDEVDSGSTTNTDLDEASIHSDDVDSLPSMRLRSRSRSQTNSLSMSSDPVAYCETSGNIEDSIDGCSQRASSVPRQHITRTGRRPSNNFGKNTSIGIQDRVSTIKSTAAVPNTVVSKPIDCDDEDASFLRISVDTPEPGDDHFGRSSGTILNTETDRVPSTSGLDVVDAEMSCYSSTEIVVPSPEKPSFLHTIEESSFMPDSLEDSRELHFAQRSEAIPSSSAFDVVDAEMNSYGPASIAVESPLKPGTSEEGDSTTNDDVIVIDDDDNETQDPKEASTPGLEMAGSTTDMHTPKQKPKKRSRWDVKRARIEGLVKATKRRKEMAAAAQSTIPGMPVPPPKKSRSMKGYAYVSESANVVKPVNHVLQPFVEAALLAQQERVTSGETTMTTADGATQTGDSDHVTECLIEEIRLGVACMGEVPNSKISSHVSRRLLLCQQIVKAQAEELTKLRAENLDLVSRSTAMVLAVKAIRDTYAVETRRITEDIIHQKKEMKFYHAEYISEAKRSQEKIQNEQAIIKAKTDDIIRENKRFEALYNLRNKELEISKQRIDDLLRIISLRDRDVIVANRDRDSYEKKLNDRLFLQTNERCTHCRSAEKSRKMLTEEISSLASSLKTAQKDRDTAQDKLNKQERISTILDKNAQRLSFEVRGYKAECERLAIEMENFKRGLEQSPMCVTPSGATPKSLQRHGGGTPLGETASCQGTPGGSDYRQPITSSHMETPVTDIGSTSSSDHGNSTPSPVDPATLSPRSLSVLPPPPAPPPPFFNWIPKNKKQDQPPPGFDSTEPSFGSPRKVHGVGPPHHMHHPRRHVNVPPTTHSQSSVHTQQLSKKQLKKLRNAEEASKCVNNTNSSIIAGNSNNVAGNYEQSILAQRENARKEKESDRPPIVSADDALGMKIPKKSDQPSRSSNPIAPVGKEEADALVRSTDSVETIKLQKEERMNEWRRQKELQKTKQQHPGTNAVFSQRVIPSTTTMPNREAFSATGLPFNGPVVKQPPPRPWNGPAPGKGDLPFEPIDESWGFNRGRCSPDMGLPWNRAPAANEPVWRRDGAQPLYPPVMPSPGSVPSSSWIPGDSWALGRGPAGPPSQPAPPVRRNFWAP